MYDGGRHVESVYAPGEAAEVEEGEDADGGAVCEVWRAADVEWVPVRLSLSLPLSLALSHSRTLIESDDA